MKKVTVIFAFAIIALFSVAIITNLSYGMRNMDLTGFVVSEDMSMPEFSGDICTDSDNGRAYLKGDVAVYGSVYIDYCIDDTRLMEYSCASLFRTSTIHVCPYGCEDGACI